MPLLLPQLLLSGLFVPREQMSSGLELASDLLPMTYAFDALQRVAADAGGSQLAVDVAVVLGSTLLALGLGALTLRRRTA